MAPVLTLLLPVDDWLVVELVADVLVEVGSVSVSLLVVFLVLELVEESLAAGVFVFDEVGVDDEIGTGVDD
jgi:hypothetical protein